MQEKFFVLITCKDKSPVTKTPIGTSAYDVNRLLDECLERENENEEIRTVCLIDEFGEFISWGEKEFKTLFK